MNYLLDHIYYWLNTATTTLGFNCIWIIGDQMENPPVPQDVPAFGFFKIITAKVLSLGGQKHTYNPDTDKIDFKVNNWYEVTMSLDIYSKDQSAVDIATAVMDFVYTEDITEHFFTNNVGFVSFDSVTDLSEIVSAQTRKRIHIVFKVNAYSELGYITDRIVSAPVDYDISE